jgi:hypothetical protein
LKKLEEGYHFHRSIIFIVMPLVKTVPRGTFWRCGKSSGRDDGVQPYREEAKWPKLFQVLAKVKFIISTSTISLPVLTTHNHALPLALTRK